VGNLKTVDERFPLHHDHVFGQDQRHSGELRTRWVIALTATTMVVEIVAGIAFGSMALLADGLHMASHAAALAITATAYRYARQRAGDRRFSFGTGKVGSLAGFASALVLALFAMLMMFESVGRLLEPVPIRFNEAIAVALVGLAVNGISVFVLGERDSAAGNGWQPRAHRHDHNLRSAYLHVLADALTSLLAILALLAAKLYGAVWMDPLMGIVGGLLVARWSWGLLRDAGGVLLDRQAPDSVLEAVRQSLECQDGIRVTDLHVWRLGPGYSGGIIGLATPDPRPPSYYKDLLPDDLGLVHVTVEVQRGEWPGEILGSNLR
jgi:cation diffusion facilitator family transporter